MVLKALANYTHAVLAFIKKCNTIISESIKARVVE